VDLGLAVQAHKPVALLQNNRHKCRRASIDKKQTRQQQLQQQQRERQQQQQAMGLATGHALEYSIQEVPFKFRITSGALPC